MTTREFNKLIKNITVDRQALVKIYDFYYRRITYFLSRTYNKAFSEDCAQEFFLNLLKKPVDCYIENPTAWVYRCSLNIANEKIEKENKYAELKVLDEKVDFEPSIEIFGDLYDKLKMLEKDERELVYLVHWDGYNLKEIAEILGVSHANARQKYSRTIKKLKQWGAI